MPRDKGYHKGLEILRDYFMFKGQANKVDAVNDLMDYLDRDPKIFVLTEREAGVLFRFITEGGSRRIDIHGEVGEIADNLAEFLMKTARKQ